MGDPSFMLKSCRVGGSGGGLQDFSVSPGSESLSLFIIIIIIINIIIIIIIYYYYYFFFYFFFPVIYFFVVSDKTCFQTWSRILLCKSS